MKIRTQTHIALKTLPRLIGAGCAVLLCLNPVQAAPDSTNPPGFKLIVDLRDGSRIVGKSLDDALSFHAPVTGAMKLPWSRFHFIVFAGAGAGTALLTAANGDTFTAHLDFEALRMETSFGQADLPVNFIRSVKVSKSGKVGPWPSELPPGLVALWSGEEDGSDSVGGNTATLWGKAAFAEGKVGQAFRFNGANSYVKIPQAPNLNPGDQITIAFWMKAAADNPMNTIQGLVTSDFYGITICNGSGGTMGVNFFLSTTANRAGTSVGDFTHISDANGGGAPVTAGQWHHVAGAYDGSKLQLYIDGRPWGNPVPHAGRITPMLPNSFVSIGSEDGRTTCPDCAGNRYFKGLIDEVAIYNRALTAAEIEAISTEQNNGQPLPPLQSPAPIQIFDGLRIRVIH